MRQLSENLLSVSEAHNFMGNRRRSSIVYLVLEVKDLISLLASPIVKVTWLGC